jgi:squalene cyclase
LSVSGEERYEVLACFHVVVKMYRYSLEERVFIVKTYWITDSIKNCQRRFVEQFGGRNPPSKRCIQLLVKKLETKGTWRREARNVGKYSA